MYSRKHGKTAWLKHWDFILLDLLLFQLAYICGYMMRMGIESPYTAPVYLNTGMIICLTDICIVFFTEPYHGILRRGYLREFRNVLRHVLTVGMTEVCCLFLSKNTAEFSRLSFLWFILTSVIFLYTGRILLKKYLAGNNKIHKKTKIVLVTTKDEADTMLEGLMPDRFTEYEIIGIAYADRTPCKEETVCGIPVVCRADGIPEYIQTRWVDEVIIGVSDKMAVPEGLVLRCLEMGLTVHDVLAGVRSRDGERCVGRVGSHTVLTTSLRLNDRRQVVAKRMIDICGGLVGLALTAAVTLVLAPAIRLSSPGPVFFCQERIGRNGKRFRIYKFRSMYQDAESRKQELMRHNEIRGLMFKMDMDPRIIGSGPDGTKKGLGWFIRKTSLDEFPQFWNVLKGDMSLVGTRPPTEDEWSQYLPSHRARLCVKPGLTGMWQISGRSDITDFEEVVALDMQYIKNWTIGMDLRILFRTVFVVLAGSGSR